MRYGSARGCCIFFPEKKSEHQKEGSRPASVRTERPKPKRKQVKGDDQKDRYGTVPVRGRIKTVRKNTCHGTVFVIQFNSVDFHGVL